MRNAVPQRRTNRSMNGMQLLHKAARSDGWKRLVDNKMRGAFGETDLDRRVIKVNKAAHKKQKGKWGIPKKDSSLINTIVHEEMHARHPKMTEKGVRKKTRTVVDKMSKRTKGRMYARFNTKTKT